MEFVSAREYARRNAESPCTVSQWAREGKLPAVKLGGSWMIDPNALPPLKRAKKSRPTAKGELLCSHCHRNRLLRHYSPSGIEKSRCRDCATHMERKRRNPLNPDVISYDLDVAVWRELRRTTPEVTALRRERIKYHTERIAAAGLAGDGEDWSDQ